MDLFDAPKVDRRQLRPHQQTAIDMLRSSVGKGNRRVVLQAPTGFGKSLTAAKIIESARAKGHRVLFTVPRLSLVDQTVAEFEREGLTSIGVLQADHPRTDLKASVQVATVQTLASRSRTKTGPDFGPLGEFGLVIVDECHETFEVVYQLMEAWPTVTFVGLSATPWARGMGAEGRWQDLRIATDINELIVAGFLSRFTVFAPDTPDLSSVKIVNGDYQTAGLEDVMGDAQLVGNVVTTWLEKAGNRPTLLFAVNRNHAKVLQGQFMAAGVSAGYCDFATDSVARRNLEKAFRAGEVKVACSVRTLTTGVDWPVSCIIDAAPTRSEMLHVQKIGRGLRINPGTEDLLILDHAGNSNRLGLVTDIRREKLSDALKPEREEREALPKPVLPKTCEKCSALYTGLVCQACGHEHPLGHGVISVDGRLVELTAPKPEDKIEQLIWLRALTSMANESSRKPGWAAFKFKEKFGKWPPYGMKVEPGPVPIEVRRFCEASYRKWRREQARASA